MFVKLTSGFTGRPLISRNLVLQELWRTGSKSYKLEVTFAIHPPFAHYNKYYITILHISQDCAKV